MNALNKATSSLLWLNNLSETKSKSEETRRPQLRAKRESLKNKLMQRLVRAAIGREEAVRFGKIFCNLIQ